MDDAMIQVWKRTENWTGDAHSSRVKKPRLTRTCMRAVKQSPRRCCSVNMARVSLRSYVRVSTWHYICQYGTTYVNM